MKNANRLIRNSLELYELDKAESQESYLDIETIFRGFTKIPLVVCERYDIKPYLIKMGLDVPPDLEVTSSSSSNEEDILNLKECSVLLKRENLIQLKDVFVSNSKNNSVGDLSCNICQKAYLSERKLLNHQQNKHMLYRPENKVRKRVSFSDKVTIHEVKEYHRCRKCPKIYEDYNSLRSHMKQIHKKRRCYICFYCSKDFVDRMFFKMHIKLHCNMCGLLLPNKKYYLEHRRTVCKSVKKYECKTCNAIFFHFMDLKDHSYEHLGTCFVCDICKDKFDNKCALAHHIKFLHSKRRPTSLFVMNSIGSYTVYLCNFCDKVSMDRALIEKHVSIFPDYGKCPTTYYKDFYFCDQRYEKINAKTAMLQHKWTHFLKTVDKNELQSHGMSIRTVYNCNEELPPFLQPKLVLEKLEVPEPKVMAPVNFADVTNFDLNNLKKPVVDPITKKTIISKYQCEKCSKYLSSNYCLSRHMDLVHGIGKGLNDFYCNYCGEIFTLPSVLKSHYCTNNTIIDKANVAAGTQMNMYDVQTCFEEINISDNEDYMQSVDFEIPAPIVELTEYVNVNILVNGGNDQIDVVGSNKFTPFSNLQYVVMQDVPIEY